MSIATDAQRINNALSAVTSGKAAIAAAITAKGVETAQNATFAEIAENIGAIESGGGVRNLAYTTHYPGQQEKTSGLTITYEIDGSFTVSGKMTSTFAYTIPFDKIKVLEVGKTYTLSMYSDGTDCDAFIYLEVGTASTTPSNPQAFTGRRGVTFAVNSGTFVCNHITVCFRNSYNGGDYGDGTNIKIMLEEGSEPHPYVSPWPISS